MVKKCRIAESILRTMAFAAICLMLLTSLVGAFSNPLDVPFKTQVLPGAWSTTKNCGQTSSLMVFSFYDGSTPTEQGIKDIDDWLFRKYGDSQAVNNYDGSYTSTTILETLAKEYGGFLNSYSASGWTIERVKQEIDAGRPVIVAVTGAPLGQSYSGHFLVAKGYTATGIITNDPGRTNGVITYDNANFANAMSSQGGAVVVVFPRDAWHFNTPNNPEGWNAVNVEASSVAPDGRYRIDPQRNDPYIYSAKLSLDANHYDSLEINMASNAPSGVAQVYFTTSSSPSYSDDKRVEFYVDRDGSWQTYTIYMANHNQWQGTITGIRIDPAAMGKEGTGKNEFDINPLMLYCKIIKAE